MIDPKLVARAQRLLNQLLQLSEVPASQAGPIGHGHPDSGMPQGIVFSQAGNVMRVRSLRETVGDRLDLAEKRDDNVEYASTISWGQLQHDRIVKGPIGHVPESSPMFNERIVKDYEGVLAPAVAVKECCSVTRVREARQKLGCDGRFGHKIAGKVKLGGQG